MDDEAGRNQAVELETFVVFLNDKDSDLQDQLKWIAKKAKLRRTVLTIYLTTGPMGYAISPQAAVTVVFYRDFTVRATHAFRSGTLKKKDIDRIAKDLSKILP